MTLKDSLKAIETGYGGSVRKLLEPIQKLTLDQFCNDRAAKRLAVEQAIVDLKLEAGEVAELLDAITAGLKLRYEDASEACLYATFFKQALERLDSGYQTDASDALQAFLQAAEKRARRLP